MKSSIFFKLKIGISWGKKAKENFNTPVLENGEERDRNNIYDKYSIIVYLDIDNIFQDSKDAIFFQEKKR